MYQVFNMGHGMEIYTKRKYTKHNKYIKKYNIDAKIIGRREAVSEKKLSIKTEKGVFFY